LQHIEKNITEGTNVPKNCQNLWNHPRLSPFSSSYFTFSGKPDRKRKPNSLERREERKKEERSNHVGKEKIKKIEKIGEKKEATKK
jgi:hypothetical protein